MKRTLSTIAGVVLAFAALLIAGGMLWLRGARPQLDGEITLAGARDTVEVWRDSMGVAHIWAAGLHDALFAQGFVHAQERGWQMELLRRVAEGRLAEALGADLLSSDRFLRTIGLWRAAGEAERRLDPEFRGYIEAYVRGVNAGIRSGRRPVELRILGIEPEPWTVRHSLALEKIMGFDLSSYGYSAALSRAAVRLGAERAAYLAPGYPRWGTTILEDAHTAPDSIDPAAHEALAAVPPPPPAAARLLDRF